MAAENAQPHVLTDATIASMADANGYELIEHGVIVIADGRIVAVGGEVPGEHAAAPRQSLGGRLVTPCLIDCHTHLVYGGSRVEEYEARLEGASYEDIAKAGGGIMSTVAATRAASEEELLESALVRLDRMLAQGTCLVEVKSGYGLDRETEAKMLRVARRLEEERPVRVRTTFLGAHTVPTGTNADTYLDEVAIPALRELHGEGLVDAVDGYCESIAFSTGQIERLFDVAAELGIPVKLHAEQLSALGGTRMAAGRGALSADHLEYAEPEDIEAMAASGSVAVLLPGAFHYLREKQLPPIQALRDAGVPMAVATDCNPGTSPMTSLPLAMHMATILFRLTPAEALRGVTVNAARALGVEDMGTIAPGLRADLAVWDLDHPAALSYRIGEAPLHARYFGGRAC